MTEIPLILSVDGSKAKAGTDTAKRGLDELKQSARGATDSINAVEGSFGRLVDVVRKFGPALSVTAMVAFTRSAIDAADALGDLSKRFGISVEALSKFGYVAKLAGTNVEAFAQGIRFMQVNISAFNQGSQQAVDAFERIGVSLGDLKGLKPEEQFTLIADRMSMIKDQAQLTASAVDIFGRSGAALIPIFSEGGEALKGMLDQAERVGVVMSAEEVEKIQRFNDALDIMNMRASSLARDGFLMLYDRLTLMQTKILEIRIAWNELSGDTEEMNQLIKQWADAKGLGGGGGGSQQDSQVRAFVQFKQEQAAAKKAAEEAAKAAKEAAEERIKAENKVNDTITKNLEGQWSFEERVRQWEKEAAEEQEKAIKEQAKAYEYLAEKMQDTLGDAFYKIATGADDLADTIKDAMIRAAADSAAAWATQQIMPSVTGFIGNGNGISTGGSGGGVAGAAQSTATSMAGSGAAAALGMSAGMAMAVGAGLLIAAIALPKIIDSFKPRAHPASTFGAEIGMDNTLTGFDYRSKHMDTQYAQGIAGYVQSILAGFAAGGTGLKGVVSGGIDDGKGFLSIAGKAVAQFDPSDESSLAGALAKFTGELAKTADVVNLDIVRAMQNLSAEGKTLQQVMEEINFALARDSLRKQFNAGNVTSYLAGASPEAAALAAEQQSFNTALATAKELGANTQLLYRVHAQNIAKIQAQYSTVTQGMQDTVNKAQALAVQYRDIGESLADAIFNLKTGALSTLSPGDQLALARSQFGTAAAAARLGDANAMQQLPQLANTFLGLSKAFYASSTDYARDFESVTAAMEAARATASRQANIQEQIAENTAAQLTATTSGFATLASIMASIANAEKVSAGSYVGKTYSSSNANELVVKNKAAIQAAGLMGVVNTLLDTYSYGTTPGDKRRSEFFAGNSGQNAAFIAAAKAAGIPGFANGGSFMVGGHPGIDANLVAFRATRGEQVTVTPPGMSNDAMLRELQKSNQHLSATVVVLQNGIGELVEQNKQNAKAIRALADSQRRTAVDKAGKK